MSGDHNNSDNPDPQSIHHENTTDETTPLLLSQTKSHETVFVESIAAPIGAETKSVHGEGPSHAKIWPSSTRWLVLLCAFVTSLSFGVTQAPMLWAIRIMTCDAYYKDHPSEVPVSISTTAISPQFNSPITTFSNAEPDRCAIRVIESSTALSISLLGASTTIFGVVNLFLTGSLIKRIGLKPTLLIQILFPAVRVFVQNVSVEVGGNPGILILQMSQIITTLGGPSGYILVLNNFITEVVDYEGRTAALGTLQGSMMFGSALGFLCGGLISDAFGIKAPFRVTCILFLSSAAYAATFLPTIPLDRSSKLESSSKPKKNGAARFFGPLAVFVPKKFLGKDNVIRTEYGSLLLACGVFLGINATGYIPTLLQLYSTDEFGFTPKENGWLIFLYSLLRGLFLTLAFPRIISLGRKWSTARDDNFRRTSEPIQERERLLSSQSQDATTLNSDSTKKEQNFVFDLHYTKFSLIADGLLTMLCSLVEQGWQMYLVATVLPFAAGTSSAAKGTILQMVGSSATSNERTDALAGVSLVENIARLSTTFLFGVIFAGFASIGKLPYVFVCNAGFALLGFGVLMFARLPLEGSHRLDKVQQETEESSE